MILDGWGINPNPKVSAIEKANTPFMDHCLKNYPNATLVTYGLEVGLPEGQMGNSEVGHMNLGAGRVVYQNLVRINMAVQTKSFLKESILNSEFQYAIETGKKVHFIGLLSNGGVHSHIYHLFGLLDAANTFGLKDNVFVHAFTDGRDCDPHSAIGFINELKQHMKETTGKLASVIGRYYAMDRDKRWERVKLAYQLMVNGVGQTTDDIENSIRQSYKNGISDEFIKPIIVDKEGLIEEGDVVINFNFRTDRGREITQVLTQSDFPEYGMKKMELRYITMTNYDKTFKGVEVIYDENEIPNTLGEVLETHGKSQIRIAETEKYPHVTFFFSGGREKEFDGEKRILCPSPKEVPTYDLKPEMSAYQITEKIVPELKNGTADFVCLNFANTDMVGHTGVFEAAVKAAEVVDSCTAKVVNAALEGGYDIIILADHGNSDVMVNSDGSPNTQHSMSPVPVILIQNENQYKIKPGKLGDIAPTILKLMNLPIPEEMTGEILLLN